MTKTLTFRFDKKGIDSLWDGPPPRLFRINPVKYRQFFVKNPEKDNTKALREMRKRLPRKNFETVRCHLHAMLRYSTRLFPCFPRLLNEFVNEEWLSVVDFHKPFHRDHIVHQPQVALIVKKLLKQVRFSPDDNRLAADFKEWVIKHVKCGELRDLATDKKGGKGFTLWDLSAFHIANGDRELDYLFHFAESLGMEKHRFRLGDGNDMYAFLFWKEVVYHACVTAGLYHDIGYPIQFLISLEKALTPNMFENLIAHWNAEAVKKYFRNHLCLTPFRAYKYDSRFPFPHTHYLQYDKALEEALQKTHGLPGALTYLYLNNQVRDWEDGENPFGLLIMELAALAMTMHDMQKLYCDTDNDKPGTVRVERPYMRLSFARDPVSFVVTLADQVQAFHRFNAAFSRIGKCEIAKRLEKSEDKGIQRFLECGVDRKAIDEQALMKLESRIDSTELEFDTPGKRLKIVYLFPSDQTEAFVNELCTFIPKNNPLLFDPAYGFLDGRPLFDRIDFDAKQLKPEQ